MGVQKTYGYATSKGVAGGIYDMFHYPVDSRFNEEENGKLHFGVGVVTGKVPGSSVALPTSASTADNFEGVVINGFDRQQDLEGKLYVLNNQNVGVMRRGRDEPDLRQRPEDRRDVQGGRAEGSAYEGRVRRSEKHEQRRAGLHQEQLRRYDPVPRKSY